MAMLGEQFEVFFDHPLPRYGFAGVKVYHARSTRGGTGCLAYVCEHGMQPRLHVAEKYGGLQSLALARLLGRGAIKCPDHQERYTFIYENNLGAPLVPMTGEPLAYGFKPDVVIDAVLKPLVSMLQEMHNADLAHGGLRVDNLFDAGVLPLQRVIVGDALTHIYLGSQPMIALPPHLSIAQSTGRGLGSPADDMYALGVICAILARSHDPMQGKTDDQIYMHKLDFGTFSTLIENERLPSNLLELLRGLLQDDADLRWGISDIFDWFEGKRTGHRQGNKKLKASRHIVLGSEKLLLPSMFAYFAARDVPGAVKLIESGEIKQWIRRSISDDKLDQRYDDALESGAEGAVGGSSRGPEWMVGRLCVAMEPTNPIFYKQLRLYPESFGPVLAELIINGQDVRPLVELINDQMVTYWMNMQPELPADFNMMINRFEQCQQFIKQKSTGYGIERCVYFLAPEIHCLSPALKNFIVHTPEQLLVALNTLAERSDRPERILDRHMVAFISVKDRKLVDRYLPDLATTDIHRQIAGTLGVLAAIQARGRMVPLPELTRWVCSWAQHTFERYHDRDIRTSLAKKIGELKDSGYLMKVMDTLFDHDRQKRDQYDYRVAVQEYYQLSVERIQLGEAMKHQDRFGTQAGRDLGALIAGIAMALTVAGFIIMRLSQGGGLW
jgi:hypothetical protein